MVRDNNGWPEGQQVERSMRRPTFLRPAGGSALSSDNNGWPEGQQVEHGSRAGRLPGQRLHNNGWPEGQQVERAVRPTPGRNGLS